MGTIYWSGLILAVLMAVFLGKGSFISISISIAFISGFILTVTLFFYYNNMKKDYPKTTYPKSIFQVSAEESPKFQKCDKRLTGSCVIDEPLQEVLNYAFRDFIQNWYYHISANEEFLLEVKESLQKIIVAFSNRAKDVDWVQYLTTKLVDDFASHFRLYRQAQGKVKGMHRKDPSFCTSLISSFFELETSMAGNLPHNSICASEDSQLGFLKELCEVLMYFLLPNEDFQNLVVKSIVKQVVVNSLVIPLIELISDPDYINRTIVWMGRDTIVSSEGFLIVLRCTDNVDELQALLEIVNHEIAVQRSKDTGGDDDTEIKQQLSSLSYVRRVVEMRLKRLTEGIVDTDSTGMPTGIDWKLYTEPGVKLCSLHFDVVLTNNIALHYFTDFMSTVSAQGYVYFYHSVEGFKVSAEQMISQISPSAIDSLPELEGIREAALHIYELYFAPNSALKVPLDETLLNKLYRRIRTEKPCSTWFDEALAKVYEIMQEEPLFPAFKRSQNYIKLLAELDLLKEVNLATEEDNTFATLKPGTKICVDEVSLGDTVSLSSMEEYALDFFPPGPEGCPSQGRNSPAIMVSEGSDFAELTAQIYNTGIASEAGNTYAVYAISVTRRDIHNAEEKWCVLRRYSDFRDFHFILLQKFPQLSGIQFPAKKTFNNLSAQFLEKRTNQLSCYLQCLMNPETIKANPGLRSELLQFLEPKAYDQGKKPLSKTVDAIVNPLKSSVKAVGHIVKAVPDTFMDGIKDGLVKAFGKKTPLESDSFVGTSKVAAGLDVEGDDNIPLSILLLLMDEVFDLKSKDQWFRKRIVILLQQIFNVTYGDTVNRKIIDFVQKITSAQQMAEYIKAFRNAIWPNGVLASPTPDRDHNTKMRTRVAAKMIMFCSLPDELRHVIGTETTRKGILHVFEMFQQHKLNQRLLYVLLEGIIETIFPDNNLQAIFQLLHSKSQPLAPKKPTGSKVADPTASKQATHKR